VLVVAGDAERDDDGDDGAKVDEDEALRDERDGLGADALREEREPGQARARAREGLERTRETRRTFMMPCTTRRKQ